MELEKLIAKGRFNEVYKSGDLVVKVFNADYLKADVFTEASIIATVEPLGLNIPAVKEVTNIDGKWAISMERVEGKTLSQLMDEEPNNVEKYVEMMVDIQVDMFSKKCPKLRNLKEKLTTKINAASIDDGKKYELLSTMENTPKHDKLCHGDFTPQNIIIDASGKAYIIDWNHATIGNASADVARSFLWLSLYNAKIADMYVNKYCEKTNTAKSYVQKWLPVVAAARISNGIPEEKELLDRWVDIVENQ
ncbi:MAG: phosphotransferase [Clostridiales bacterium]|nr:phosphotransferase [Clostridiales bacterium]